MRRAVLNWTTNARAYVGITLLALLAWGAVLIFAPNALYWDDWVLNNRDTVRMFAENGLPWIGYIQAGLLDLGAWSFKVVDLVATIAVGCLAYRISGRGLSLPGWQRWLIAALITVLPLNTGRVAVSILDTYALSLLAFFVGWWLLVGRRPTPGHGVVRYAIAALFLFGSYTTASFLVFTIFPVAHLMYLTIPNNGHVLRGVLRFIGRFWYVLAAPVVFWAFRTVFLTPSGLYAGYNAFAPFALPLTVTEQVAIVMLAVFVAGLVVLFCCYRIAPLQQGRGAAAAMLVLALATATAGYELYRTKSAGGLVSDVVPIGMIVAGVLLFVLAIVGLAGAGRRIGLADRTVATSLVAMTGVGLIALSVAMLPYVLVGKLPSFEVWDTRHQLLMPVGVAILVVATARAWSALTGRRAALAIGLAITAVCAGASLVVTLHLVADWNKQEQVIVALRHEPLVRHTSTVVFSDHAPSFGYDSRVYDFYEYTGWLVTAYGDHKRLGLPKLALPQLRDGSFPSTADGVALRYGFGEYRPSDEGVLVTITPTPGASWLGLLFNHKSLTLSVRPIDNLLP